MVLVVSIGFGVGVVAGVGVTGGRGVSTLGGGVVTGGCGVSSLGGGEVLASTSVLGGVVGFLVGVVGLLLTVGIGGCVGGESVGGLGGDMRLSVGGVGGECAMSSRMDLRCGGWCTGMYFLRNFLFRRVCLPDPSILMRYWWNWRTSMTMPVRSHLFG